MNLKRRNFLIFLGASLGGTVLGNANTKNHLPFSEPATAAKLLGRLNFTPVKVPVPLSIDSITGKASGKAQKLAYQTYQVKDDLILPEGYTYNVIAAWGDRLGDSRFGYNNDYLSYLETEPGQGFLTVNFEYISGKTWMETYARVIGKTLPFGAVKTALAERDGEINAFGLPEGNPLKEQIKEIAKEGLIDQGLGIISIRKNRDGNWERTYSASDRRITGISGLEDNRYLKATGPGVSVFVKNNKKGYDDGLANKIIGTFQNCAGGTTPWGTVLSAEENFQDQVPEPVMADGSSLDPSQKPFILNDKEVDGRANVFGLAGNKYGWMVEVDPTNPQDYGTKHTWLGRYRHEAFGLRAVPGKPLAVYSGCDRRGGHLYKFVSDNKVSDLKSKSNSRLFDDGMLFGAKFNPDGTGTWIALTPYTPLDPVLPSQVIGKNGQGMVPLPNPDRQQGGIVKITSDEAAKKFKQQFSSLGDLYEGNLIEKQGAILIDAHFAANAVGITCTARPEDTQVTDNGNLYITFTSGSPGNDGGPDKRIFRGPNGEIPHEYGWIVRLIENDLDPAATGFRWEIVAIGGEPARGAAGFANPDNLEIDRQGNIWLLTDISTSRQNKELISRTENGQPVSQSSVSGVFGNNSAWVISPYGINAGQAYPFAIGPMETEMTGPFFTEDQTTLFLSVQHPGERNGIRRNMNSEIRQFEMETTDGETFRQNREVPIGSNWPGKQVNDPPRPAVVAIRRADGRSIS
ncbi:MAG: DUF839 domain-containing protein [Prochloraceae cyanobacterium]|nr:DUF839 domain-containing protein [Prochloraceae cyanobacterium]